MTARSTTSMARLFAMAAGAACIITATPAAAVKFSEASVEGRYSGFLEGLSTQVGGQPLPAPAPTSMVSYFKADGSGAFTDVRVTVNNAGCVIADYRGTGTYDVKTTGVATAVLTLASVAEPFDTGACDPATLPPTVDTAEYEFDFAINRSVPDSSQILDTVAP